LNVLPYSTFISIRTTDLDSKYLLLPLGGWGKIDNYSSLSINRKYLDAVYHSVIIDPAILIAGSKSLTCH